jgi:3-methyladenine DNA glycosylase AlkD
MGLGRMEKPSSFDAKALAAEIATAVDALSRPTATAVRTLRRQWSRRLAAESARNLLAVALALPRDSSFAHRQFAYELVHHHPAALGCLGEKELARLGTGLAGWADVDTFACYLSGPAWRERQVTDRLIHRWARSDDRWWRRAALVSTVPLNNRARGGRGDAARTLAVCRLLVADHDDMVVKALSWALRELSKRDADAVLRFLTEQESELASRVRREVTHKLATGLKNPRRRA